MIGGPAVPPEFEVGARDWTPRSLDPWLMGMRELMFFGSLFIAGTMVAFLSPFGGVLQFLGVSGSILFISYDSQFAPARIWIAADLEIGLVVALISTALVLLSMALPLGVGSRRTHFWTMSSVFAFHPSDPYSSHLNVLGLLGALLSSFAMALPWYIGWPWMGYVTQNAVSDLTVLSNFWEFYDINPAMIQLGSILFIIGTLALFFTTLGLIFQGPGFLILLAETTGSWRWELLPSNEWLSPGVVLAMIGMGLVLVSIFVPASLYGIPRPTRIHHRFFTWGVGDINNGERRRP